MAIDLRRMNQLLITVVIGINSPKAIPSPAMSTEEEINLPDGLSLRQAEQAQGRNKIKANNILSGTEPGDGHAGHRSQKAADHEEEDIRTGQGGTAPMKGLAHRRQEQTIGIGNIPAQTGIGRHEADQGGPSVKTLRSQSGRQRSLLITRISFNKNSKIGGRKTTLASPEKNDKRTCLKNEFLFIGLIRFFSS